MKFWAFPFLAVKCTHYVLFYTVLYDPIGSYCLVYWMDEESVSAVCAENIVQPSPSQMVVGDECQVKCGRRMHKGLLSATGMHG